MVAGVVFLSRDRTEQKRAEESLARNEANYRLLFENALEGIFVIQADRVQLANPRAREMTGYNLEQLASRPFYDFLPPEDRDQVLERHLEWLESARPTDGGVIRFSCLDGRLRYFEVKSAKIEWDHHLAVLTFLNDITEARQNQRRLDRYQNQLRRMTSKLTVAEYRERRRLAEEIHDVIAQNLFVAKMKVDGLRGAPENADVRRRIEEVGGDIQQLLQDVRRVIGEVRPPTLSVLGLEAALAGLAEKVGQEHPLAVDFRREGDALSLSEDFRDLLYRSTRELIYNVVKHAGADRASITVAGRADGIEIRVWDNGRGFDPDRITLAGEGFGLFSIRERLQPLGGDLFIASELDGGTLVRIVAPRSVVATEEGTTDE
jgi:PAS domain S-box-containing protein